MKLDFSEVVGLIGLISGAIYFIGDRLINLYYNSKKEAQEAREKAVTTAIENLENMVSDHKVDIKKSTEAIEQAEKEIVLIKYQIIELKKLYDSIGDKYDKSVQRIDNFLEDLRDKFKSSKVNVGHDTVIIKGNKGEK